MEWHHDSNPSHKLCLLRTNKFSTHPRAFLTVMRYSTKKKIQIKIHDTYVNTTPRFLTRKLKGRHLLKRALKVLSERRNANDSNKIPPTPKTVRQSAKVNLPVNWSGIACNRRTCIFNRFGRRKVCSEGGKFTDRARPRQRTHLRRKRVYEEQRIGQLNIWMSVLSKFIDIKQN